MLLAGHDDVVEDLDLQNVARLFQPLCGAYVRARWRRVAARVIVHQHDAPSGTDNGGTYFPASIAKRIAARDGRDALSERELEVLRLVVQGRANKQIADELGIAEITAKVHVSHILEKLGVPDRTRAATPAIERGLIRI